MRLLCPLSSRQVGRSLTLLSLTSQFWHEVNMKRFAVLGMMALVALATIGITCGVLWVSVDYPIAPFLYAIGIVLFAKITNDRFLGRVIGLTTVTMVVLAVAAALAFQSGISMVILYTAGVIYLALRGKKLILEVWNEPEK
jgi:hypothetical protein